MSNEKDTLRPEYDPELIKSGKRGKYVSREPLNNSRLLSTDYGVCG